MHKTITKTDEISILYNPDCSKAKKVYAYARSIANKVTFMEYSSSRKTATQWKQILVSLGLKPKDLLDKSKRYYQENLRGRDFEDRDWLHVVMNNSNLIRSPIALRGGKAMLLDNPTDIYHL